MKTKLNYDGVERLVELREILKIALVSSEDMIDMVEEMLINNEIPSEFGLKFSDSIVNEYESLKDLISLIAINSLSKEHWKEITQILKRLSIDYNNSRRILLKNRQTYEISENAFFDLRDEMKNKVEIYKQCKEIIIDFYSIVE